MLIQEYNESWAKDFGTIKHIIQEVLIDLDISIEHIGSTSIPRLAAKPIIDIDIVYNKPTDFDAIKVKLEEIGFYHNGNQGIEGREVFKRNPSWRTHPILDSITHHLYACHVDSHELHNHILFRNYLIAHEDIRIAYQNLKYMIAEKANQNKKLYAQMKEIKAKNFIETVVKKAKNEKTILCIRQNTIQ